MALLNLIASFPEPASTCVPSPVSASFSKASQLELDTPIKGLSCLQQRRRLGLGLSVATALREGVETHLKHLIEGGATELTWGEREPQWHEKTQGMNVIAKGNGMTEPSCKAVTEIGHKDVHESSAPDSTCLSTLLSPSSSLLQRRRLGLALKAATARREGAENKLKHLIPGGATKLTWNKHGYVVPRHIVTGEPEPQCNEKTQGMNVIVEGNGMTESSCKILENVTESTHKDVVGLQFRQSSFSLDTIAPPTNDFLPSYEELEEEGDHAPEELEEEEEEKDDDEEEEVAEDEK